MRNLKSILSIFLLLLSNTIFAQSYYMHEAAEDGSGLWGALDGIASVLTFLLIGAMLFVFFFAMIPAKIDNMKFDRKYERRKKILEKEARDILFSKRNLPLYQKINSNNCFVQWFIDGYMDGVDNGLERREWIPHTIMDFETISVEEYVKRRNFKGLRQELMGGGCRIF